MESHYVLSEKSDKLRSVLAQYGRVAVAFSAGVDSTFLLKTAQDVFGNDVIAVTAKTVSSPEQEVREAESFCKKNGIRQIVVFVDQMSIPGFAENPPDRCYICKKELFKSLKAAAANTGFDMLVDGTNADDLLDYRPGVRALRELHISSPLQEAALTKQDIRILSREMHLTTWDKPSLACLATRIPYGETITPQKLFVIDQAEQYLRNNGFCQVRVRMHGKLARIEIEASQFSRITDPCLSKDICQKMTSLGFDYVTLDLNGYVSGSMNKPSILSESIRDCCI